MNISRRLLRSRVLTLLHSIAPSSSVRIQFVGVLINPSVRTSYIKAPSSLHSPSSRCRNRLESKWNKRARGSIAINWAWQSVAGPLLRFLQLATSHIVAKIENNFFHIHFIENTNKRKIYFLESGPTPLQETNFPFTCPFAKMSVKEIILNFLDLGWLTSDPPRPDGKNLPSIPRHKAFYSLTKEMEM